MFTKYICTYFNIDYLARGLALIESINRNNPETLIYVLAIDEKVETYLSKRYRNVEVISINYFNSQNTSNKSNYSDEKQFLFSITPNLCKMILAENKEIDVLLYLDADVFVTSDITPIYDEFSDFSIGACSHRINNFFKLFFKNYGVYNVGVNLFRNDEIGIRCLSDWSRECNEWYPNKPGYKLSFFSDQIFLDKWPSTYKNKFVEIKNIGVNVAPWNVINYNFKFINNDYYVNNKKVIIYHFSSLINEGNGIWNSNSGLALFYLTKELKSFYISYIKNILSHNLKTEKIVALNFNSSILKKIFYYIFEFFLINKIKL